MRKKLGFAKPEVKPNDTMAEEEVKLNSFLLTTKQSLSMSVKKAQKALSASQRMKCEVMWISKKKIKLRICEQSVKYLNDEQMKLTEAFLN